MVRKTPQTNPPNCAGFAEISQWIHQTKVHSQFADGGRFAARYDQPVQSVQVIGKTYFRGLNAQPFEHNNVFGKVTLKSKNTDPHNCSGHKYDISRPCQ